MNKISRHAGLGLVLVCASILIAQVLIRPAVGLANNNDFPKMAEPFGLGPEQGVWESHLDENFIYNYVRAARYCCYNGDFWKAEFLSTEYFFVDLAQGLQRIFQPGPRFDIRWLGAVHGLLFLPAIGVWIYALAPRWRLYTGWLAVLIWTDVAYVEYLNTFYQDTAAIIGLLFVAGAGLHAVRNSCSRGFPLIAVCGATLFAASKSQHAIPTLVFLPLFISFALRSQTQLARGIWAAGIILVLAGGSIVLGRSTDRFRSIGVFNLVFFRIAPTAPDPLRALEELGLGREELAFVKMHAYSPGSPATTPEWVRRFSARCNYGTILKYYIRHPIVPIRFLYEDLSGPAWQIRPWGNRSLDDGFRPNDQATHFTLWSNLRSFLFKRAPWHMIVLVLVTLGSVAWLLVRSPSDRAFAVLILTIQMLAIAEYGVSVLADATETERHLILFHAATEIVILSLPLLLSRVYARYRLDAA